MDSVTPSVKPINNENTELSAVLLEKIDSLERRVEDREREIRKQDKEIENKNKLIEDLVKQGEQNQYLLAQQGQKIIELGAPKKKKWFWF